MQKIVLASGNKGKLKELEQMLQPLELQVLSQSHFNLQTPEETGLTFVENAILKARFACQKTDLPAIADDSGLEVDALQGAPGIYSARYAGEQASDQDNLIKLLKDTAVFSAKDRTCRFHCVIVFMLHPSDPTPIICHGVWEGRLLKEPVGKNGFGYDPIFYVPDHKCASAELSAEQKNKLSHRGQALRQLLNCLHGRL